MVNFNEVVLEELVVHHVGNKSQDELLKVSDNTLNLNDELVLDLLLKYFFKPFKGDVFYQFTHETDLNLNEIYHYADNIFQGETNFHTQSVNIAKHLYEHATHPNIKGGEMYVVRLSNCYIEDQYTDAIGIFKSENKETFLKVYEEGTNLNVGSESGININKLDKGCIVFNMEKESGYRVCAVDNLNKNSEAQYWMEDFLGLKSREDSYYHTKNLLDMCKGFCEEILTPENAVNKKEQLYMMNKSMNFFNENETFDVQSFEQNVMEEPALIDAFNEYRDNYVEQKEINYFDEFDISKPAVKKQKPAFRSVLKLDKNFHVYIHGNHDLIERGYDENRRMSFYTVYFVNES